MSELEETTDLRIDWTKMKRTVSLDADVVPCVVQDADTKTVLVVASVNEQALRRAVERRTAVFWSTSRNELWEKGKTSGNEFELVEVRVNCEQNSLLYLVRPRGEGMCHTKDASGRARTSCFYRRLTSDGRSLEFIEP